MIDRSEISRALAKALAYKNCGKQADAELWAIKLVRLLERELADVAVHESQKVEKGQVLFTLDQEPFRIALAGAEANLGRRPIARSTRRSSRPGPMSPYMTPTISVSSNL